MTPIERRNAQLQFLQAYSIELEADCAGIIQATPAAEAPNITVEAHKAWADKLKEFQTKAAAVKDLIEYLGECPVDPRAEADAAMKRITDLEVEVAEAQKNLEDAKVVHALALEQVQKSGKADLTNRF